MLLTEPELALRWLTRARRGALALELVVMGLAELGTGLHLHSAGLVAAVAGWAAVDVAAAWVEPRARAVVALGAFDLVALTVALGLSGGPSNPLMSAYLVYLALFAIVLTPRWAWGSVAFALVLQAVAILQPVTGIGLRPEELSAAHLLGHLAASGLTSIAITWFVSRVSAALHEQELASRAAEARRATTERLAALGTLAAGVAHELATPLGTIQLAAEQLGDRIGPEDHELLASQVDRCRSILDRLRGREPDLSSCALDLRGWVEEWSRGTPGVAVEVHADEAPRVAGGEHSWRAAVWTALDNASHAGARRVTVRLVSSEPAVEVQLDDDGAGLPPDDLSRAGEPFRSTWGGTGLGLFVARSFAQSVGGDVALESLPRGARVRLRLAREAQ